ncbi:chromate resistance protein [Kaistia dalseonensis]|uniref:Rhodanese-related sulfurtransferase n=1 Tax=Kaistia dalseonensis TaxID=410840 RepID=A0ABU0H3T1_9HYPH|nr:chromate resistance protein ChrB domain-containing protein [Kaistia dalseonensis]MCX5494376.1 chromate resistance protein [Kaistia dalseonensis]MDQ0436958.1 rhodanese-related sulfurtransferase [Kaistia dalseonensis]
MPSNTEISVSQLSRLAGLPTAPIIINVRTPEDFDADPRLLPAALRLDFQTVATWAAEFAGRDVVIVCQKGLKPSQGVTAWLRHEGIKAETSESGFEAWRALGGLLVRTDKLPPRDAANRTVWVTRARPKVDRIACPWLIRRFIDPDALFLFVAASEVAALAERFNATAFDVDGGNWSHRGERCTFDTTTEEFGLTSEPLHRLALIVRADTARLDLVPQAAGFLAASLGLSRMFRDDLEQLEAGLLLYDVFYRWCRDATEETHNWLAPGEMVDGLGLAETTPGPLIMVLQFVGFLAAHRAPCSLDPLLAVCLGALLTTRATFAPCFFWMFLGAPYIEALRGNKAVSSALLAITAAVLGVMINLALWFGLHVVFRAVRSFGVFSVGPICRC